MSQMPFLAADYGRGLPTFNVIVFPSTLGPEELHDFIIWMSDSRFWYDETGFFHRYMGRYTPVTTMDVLEAFRNQNAKSIIQTHYSVK